MYTFDVLLVLRSGQDEQAKGEDFRLPVMYDLI